MTGNLRDMENFGTTPFDPEQTHPSSAVPPGTGGSGVSGGPGRPGRGGRSRMIRWTAGIGAAALLIGGGIAAAGFSSGPASASTSQSSAADLQLTSADIQAVAPGLTQKPTPATLRTCLAAARATAKAGNKAAARQAARACLAGLPPALRLRGEHGTFTVQAKNGPVTVVWERGTVTAAPGGGTTFTVTAKDNTAWTWTLTSKTRIRQGGKPVTAGSLALNSKVFVFGRVIGGADTAVGVRIAK